MNIQENKLSVNVPSTTLNLKDIAPMTTSNTTTLLSQVIEQLKNIDEPKLMQAHNDYCQTLGYEDEIFYNDEDEINSHFATAFDVLRNLQHYNLSDDYFYFHNANLISFNYLTSEESPITFSELAQWIIDNESYSEYDIEVMTKDDMLASIEDNITDDENMLNEVILLLSPPLKHRKVTLSCNRNSYNEYKIKQVMEFISGYNEKQLTILINHLGISM